MHELTTTSIANTIRKNWPELRALMTGGMPQFVYGKKNFTDIPVFCFHEALSPELEQQLEFLQLNGYRTLDGADLMRRLSDPQYRNDGKDIVLTFDDGLASVWHIGFPLFRKYECKIILFVVAGLVPKAEACREVHDDDCSGDFREGASLCTWPELESMHRSGIVDIQSHGMAHALISTSNDIEGFISPSFDPYNFGNIHVPLYRNRHGQDDRTPLLGHPIYKHDSRLSPKRRYLDPIEVRLASESYVAARGGKTFFNRHSWASELRACIRSLPASAKEGQFETSHERMLAIRTELVNSKRELEDRLHGKSVKHFCFPWFRTSEESILCAGEAGYQVIHVGAGPRSHMGQTGHSQVINRIQQEYVLCLPGKGRSNLLSIPASKMRARFNSKARRS